MQKPLGQYKPAVQGTAAQPAVGFGLHLRLNLAMMAVCGIRGGCVCQEDCGLAGEQFDAHGLRLGRTGASIV